MLWRTVVDAKNVLALHRSLRPCAGKLDQGLRAVDRHLAVLDGQRNLGSELRRPQVDAACRCMLRILYLKRCSGRRIF
jgi:hypothetical protein